MIITAICAFSVKYYRKKLKDYIKYELSVANQDLIHDISLIKQETNSYNASNNNVLFFRLGDYSYNRLYSSFRQNNFEFNFYYNLLLNNKLTENEKSFFEQICNFTVEEGIEKVQVANAYNCLAILQSKKNSIEEQLRSIKNISYALNIIYLPQHALNLAKIITKEHEQQTLSLTKEKNLAQYFSGHTEKEVAFLNRLITLNIPDLTIKALYRLSMIYLLGHSSALEETNPDLEKATLILSKITGLINVKNFKTLDILLVINDKYAPHAATTIASALLNSDLDSFYHFYFLINPQDPISEESKKKLASMQYIRNYKIDFIEVDHNLIPINLIKEKSEICMKDEGNYPLSITYRVFLDKILPNLDKILSLDADLLVLRDLNYFNNIDMQNYFIAASFDIGNSVFNRTECNQAIPNFYFNAGVMMFNLKNIRDNNGNKNILTVLNTTKCNLRWFEQDLLNIAFADRIYNISTRCIHPIMSKVLTILAILQNLYYTIMPDKNLGINILNN
ncbi:MAG: glycosyltransferase [Rickettsia endosymbiont of Argas persicus]